MKKLTVFIFSLICFAAVSVYACEISFLSDKPGYSVGDIAVVTLTLKLTHKNCVKEAIEPQIKVTGCELVAKTKFKLKSPDVWEIKYKIKINAKNAMINAYQDCTKGGSANTLKLNVK